MSFQITHSLDDLVMALLVVAPRGRLSSDPRRGDTDGMDLVRRQAAADALGSVRAENLDPSATAEALLARWVRGELSTDQLVHARRLLATGGSVEALLAPASGS